MVRTPNGKLFNRPIDLFYPLEVSEEGNEEARITTAAKDKLEEPIALRTGEAQRRLFNQVVKEKETKTITYYFSPILPIIST
ncbi:unnamed protein product [Dracunculus medinensis]|uniref:Uncharacterized protein n=1 Tax=Dracunculus medinensis TaxID=318479 RepID=A0A0N4UR08_DRAME|nr:unnamed protein product [Dracunculus medinensis]